MTTGGVNKAKQQLARRINQLLLENPELSQRKVALQVRSEGHRGSNTLIRSLVRIGKSRSANPALLRIDAGLTLGVRSQGGNEAYRQAVALFDALGAEKTEKKFRDKYTYVSLDWAATIVVEILLDGRRQGTETINVAGKIVQRIEDYSEVLVNQRILAQVEGQVARFYSRMIGGKDVSYVEALSFRVISRDFTKTNVQLRGR